MKSRPSINFSPLSSFLSVNRPDTLGIDFGYDANGMLFIYKRREEMSLPLALKMSEVEKQIASQAACVLDRCPRGVSWKQH